MAHLCVLMFFTMATGLQISGSSQSAQQVGIQIGPHANELERYAADELAGYLDKLFHVGAKPTVEQPDSADVVLLVGTPETTPAASHALH